MVNFCETNGSQIRKPTRGDERATRLLRILEHLNEQEHPVPVGELASLIGREFGISEVTLRSDLAALCALRGIRKLARGTYEALPPPSSASGAALEGGTLFATRLRHRAEQKIAIAGAVVALLQQHAGMRVLLLDAGTTTYYVADRLSELAGLDLIVWTSSLAAAARLGGSRGISVRLLGGEFHPDYAVVSGDETARALRALAGPEVAGTDLASPVPQFPGTHCVLDVNYVSEDGRLFTDESRERLQKRLMADLAEEVTIVADASKLFGPRLGLGAHEVTPLSHLAGKRTVRLVTDPSATPAQRELARQALQVAFPGRDLAVQEEHHALTFIVGSQHET